MKKIIFLLLFFGIASVCFSQQSNKKIHLTGNFPDVKGGRVFMYSQRIDTFLINGKFNFLLDSIKEGVHSIDIIYPWPKADTILYNDNNGNIVKKKSKISHKIILSKSFYINPNQSSNYHFQLAGKVTVKMLNNWEVINYGQNKTYGIKIITDAEDSRLYDRFNELENVYKEIKFYNIVDSLYKLKYKIRQILY